MQCVYAGNSATTKLISVFKGRALLIRCMSAHHYLGVYKCFHTRDIDVDKLPSAENWDTVHIERQLDAG